MRKNHNKIASIIIVFLFSCSFLLFISLIDLKELSIKDFINGNIQTKIETQLKNNMPKRNWIIKIKTKFETLTLDKETNEVYRGNDGYLLKRFNNDLKNDEITMSLNNFQRQIEYVNLNLILSPSSITINNDKLPMFSYSDNELDSIKKIYKNILFNTIDIYEILKNNNNKYQLFYKTDTNWTVYGAYYAYYEYCIQNNITPISINDFDIEVVSTLFKGNLTKYVEHTSTYDKMHMFYLKNSNYKVSNNNILYDINKLNSNNMYEYYLGEERDLTIITNESTTSKKEIVIISDSYATSIIPFIINHYKKVHFININHYNGVISDYIKDNYYINDAIILFNINTTNTSNFTKIK